MNKIADIPAGHRLAVHHIHNFFDLCVWREDECEQEKRAWRRHLPRYVTVAYLYNEADELVAKGTAICSPRVTSTTPCAMTWWWSRCSAAL